MNDLERLMEAVGKRVTLKANTLEVAAELTECKPVGSIETSAVSVLFETEQQEVMPQQIFQVLGEKLGELSLFLVPIGPGKRGVVYEAIIN